MAAGARKGSPAASSIAVHTWLRLLRHAPTARVQAHAKINLILEVLGRRPDGFHEIRSVLVPIGLSDIVEVQLARQGLSLEVHGAPELAGPANLMVRAVLAFKDAFGVPGGIRLRLQKRIPIGAGLGGGSSDAAAVLRGLARLCRVTDRKRLGQLAANLGSDVPYFLGPGPAIITGRGENVSPVSALPRLWLVLHKPAFQISAAEAYRAWSSPGGPGRRSPRLPAPLTALGSAVKWPNPLGTRLRKCRSVTGVGRLLVNDLQPGCLWSHPELGSVLGQLQEAAPLGAQMSGSGPTCFGLFATRVHAEREAARLAAGSHERWILTRSLNSFSPVHLIDAPVAKLRPGVASWRSPTSRSFPSRKRS
jgi:4-diphosphocytidyl-2-C-methyl-D-erythritol kinase